MSENSRNFLTREALREVIFGTDTRAGRLFDLVLLYVILFSVLVVIIDSIPEVHERYAFIFVPLEWGLTVIFGIEYFLRLYSAERTLKYAFSLWGIIDFVAFFPSVLVLLFSGGHVLIILRLARMMRIFRILKLTRFVAESELLYQALKQSFYKITVFMVFIVVLVVVLGSIMYTIEGEKNGFTSIPQSIYWAVITITTVGYGDVVPATDFGKFVATVTMLLGYSILAVPTGIITYELSKMGSPEVKPNSCGTCSKQNPRDARYCMQCGDRLFENG